MITFFKLFILYCIPTVICIQKYKTFSQNLIFSFFVILGVTVTNLNGLDSRFIVSVYISIFYQSSNIKNKIE